MGTDKALLVPGDGGPPLARRALLALEGAGADPVVAVGGDREALGRLGLRVIDDREPDGGPLVGLVTGLRASPHPMAVVLTCDMPAIDQASVRRLVDALAADDRAVGAVPVVEGRRQILTAAYRTAVLDHLEEALAAGERSVRRAIDGAPILEVHDLEPFPLADLDLPEDVDHYARNTDPHRPSAND
jgi:molybdopterin-guanine dinucleotide biosynthesis protein A